MLCHVRVNVHQLGIGISSHQGCVPHVSSGVESDSGKNHKEFSSLGKTCASTHLSQECRLKTWMGVKTCRTYSEQKKLDSGPTATVSKGETVLLKIARRERGCSGLWSGFQTNPDINLVLLPPSPHLTHCLSFLWWSCLPSLHHLVYSTISQLALRKISHTRCSAGQQKRPSPLQGLTRNWPHE